MIPLYKKIARIIRTIILMVRSMGLEPIWSPTRPSNVRVCLFRHDRPRMSARRLRPSIMIIVTKYRFVNSKIYSGKNA